MFSLKRFFEKRDRQRLQAKEDKVNSEINAMAEATKAECEAGYHLMAEYENKSMERYKSSRFYKIFKVRFYGLQGGRWYYGIATNCEDIDLGFDFEIPKGYKPISNNFDKTPSKHGKYNTRQVQIVPIGAIEITREEFEEKIGLDWAGIKEHFNF